MALWTYPAGPLVSFVIVAVCAVVLARRGRVRTAWAALALWAAANAIEVAGKLAIDRPGWRYALHSSYPSGHTLRACVVAAVLVWTCGRVAFPAVAWALLVPLALVLLRDHTVTDVTGGLLAALALLALWRSRVVRPLAANYHP